MQNFPTKVYKPEEQGILGVNMKDGKEEFHERRLEMLKKREEFLKSMDEKELRAFIKGYMMAERITFKRLKSVVGCSCDNCCEESCRESSSCGCGSCGNSSCGCGQENCNCSKK